MHLSDILAATNALLNASCAVCLVAGWRRIRALDRRAHRRWMLAAFSISCIFLASYLTRVALSGTHTYPPEAPFRTFYLVMLASHVILAAFVPFLAVGSIVLAWKERLPLHRKLARVTLPVWLYVSVTGVGVYIMLYHVAG